MIWDLRANYLGNVTPNRRMRWGEGTKLQDKAAVFHGKITADYGERTILSVSLLYIVKYVQGWFPNNTSPRVSSFTRIEAVAPHRDAFRSTAKWELPTC